MQIRPLPEWLPWDGLFDAPQQLVGCGDNRALTLFGELVLDHLAVRQNVGLADAGAALAQGQLDAFLERLASSGVDGGGRGASVPDLVEPRSSLSADVLEPG